MLDPLWACRRGGTCQAVDTAPSSSDPVVFEDRVSSQGSDKIHEYCIEDSSDMRVHTKDASKFFSFAHRSHVQDSKVDSSGMTPQTPLSSISV